MGSGYLYPYHFGAKGFIKGQLEQNKDGQVVLRTREGVIPVKVEGDGVPLGEEVVFRLLREEPGLVVLTPYRLETIGERCLFLKNCLPVRRTSAGNLSLLPYRKICR